MHHGGANPPSPVFPGVWRGNKSGKKEFFMSKIVSKFTLAAGVVLALGFTLSCSEAQAAGQSDFYGVWVQGSQYFEINKEAITIFRINSDDLEKSKYRIVKWEKESNKNFIVYTLSENDRKIDFRVSIDAYSDLQLSFYGVRYEAKKSSAAELNKAIKEVAAKKAAREKEKAASVQRGSFSDQRDGKTYKTVKIGEQTWMAENLNYNVSGSKCYGNDESNCQKYSRLYDWNTAMKSCPYAWHLPRRDEWEKLVDFAGGYEVAGTYLKAKSGWWNKRRDNKNGNGTDNYGFSALPGGFGDSDGNFDLVGDCGFWWSASEYSASEYNGAYYRGIGYDFFNVGSPDFDKSYLFSVRCVQDFVAVESVSELQAPEEYIDAATAHEVAKKPVVKKPTTPAAPAVR
jgi:uncharacterized protein (TIGR02145 family)